MTGEQRQRLRYVLGDFVSSNVAWFFFNLLRYHFGFVKGHISLSSFLTSDNVVVGQIVFPLLMIECRLQQFYDNPRGAHQRHGREPHREL